MKEPSSWTNPIMQALPLAQTHVPRPQVEGELARQLVLETADQGPLAIHGLPGVGKTTTAAAVCHRDPVRGRFSDGILWVTLGQEPEILPLIQGWIQSLGEYGFRAVTVEEASSRLRDMLADKACLLVLDDVWQADHARPFLAGGPRCRVLLTSRDTSLARALDAAVYGLDVMTLAQALALFENRLGRLGEDEAQASRLVRSLGYLPLALELAAAQVARGATWTELQAAFDAGLANLAALDLGPAQQRNESVRLSFGLSLDALAPADREGFAWLGVLPEDVRIGPGMAATLWGQSREDAQVRLERLADAALLRRIEPTTYTLHDLLRDEARLRLAGRMPLPQAQVEFLARYRALTQEGLWSTLAEDGYVHEHLTWHMEQAGQPQALHDLLSQETPEGRNGWFEARDALGQVGGYLTDVRRAWRLAEHTDEVVLLCRYALITASINSQALHIGPDLIVGLVEAGLWQSAQGLAYARQVPGGTQRARTLAGLLPYLPESLKEKVSDEVLSASQGRPGQLHPSSTLALLAPHLSEPQRSRMIENVMAQCWPLDAGWRTSALLWLLPYLSESQRTQVVEGVWDLGPEHEDLRLEILEFLPAVRREEIVEEALADARDPDFEGYLAAWVAPLLPYLPEPQKSQVLAEALADLRGVEDDDFRGESLAGLVPHLPEPQRAEAVEEVLALSPALGWNVRWGVLVKMARYLPRPRQPRVLLQALADARRVRDDTYLVWNMACMAGHIPDPEQPAMVAEILAAAREVEDPIWRASSLLRLFPLLQDEARDEVLIEVLAAARSISGKQSRSAALLALLEAVPAGSQKTSPAESGVGAPSSLSLREQIVAESLATIKKQILGQISTLAALAPHLPARYLPEALSIVDRIEGPESRAMALGSLAPYLPPALYPTALRIARAFKPKSISRAWALASLAVHLPEEFEGQVPESPLELARQVRNSSRRARLLARMAAHAPQNLLPEILAEMRAIRTAGTRTEGLVDLLPHLPEPMKDEAVQEALRVMRLFGDAAPGSLVARLLPYLDSPVEEEMVAPALDGRDPWLTVRLIPYLEAPLREQILVEAFVKWRRFRPQLEAIITPDLGWISSLASFGPWLAELPRSELGPLWRETLAILASHARFELAFDLHALLPVVVALGGRNAVRGMYRSIQDVRRWWP